MRFRRVLLGCALAVLPVGAWASTAVAAERAGTVDLSKVKAERPVVDTVLAERPRVANAARAIARVSLNDANGVPITIDSTVPEFDLNQVAAVLNSTYHGAELGRLKIHVVRLADIPGLCGSDQAIACYLRMPGGVGELWFAADDTDWKHSLVHEYGHHMDNQYGNFGQLHSYGIGVGCLIGTDGTRNWFFERMLAKNTKASFSCAASEWELLLPELFAEDFVYFNGIVNWQLPTAKPPTNQQLNAMKADFEQPIYTRKIDATRKIKHRRAKWFRVTVPNWALVQITVSGGRGRDFDIFVYEKTATKFWDRAITNGRRERLTTVVPPGTWDIGIGAFKKTGKAKVKIRIL